MRQSTRGQVLVIFALVLAVLIGFAALGVDVAYLYSIKHELQRSADSGALAGASAFFDGDWNHPAIRAVAEARARGLMGRVLSDYMAGMLFVFASADQQTFWMRNTPSSLDMIFVDAGGKVLNTAAYTTPMSDQLYSSVGPAKYVVEANGNEGPSFALLNHLGRLHRRMLSLRRCRNLAGTNGGGIALKGLSLESLDDPLLHQRNADLCLPTGQPGRIEWDILGRIARN